ncbi:MAG: hypothetical protein IJU19_06980 [Bacteroidales bacterium]|nr:hypothetical protein [Bacteroidales bacterium]
MKCRLTGILLLAASLAACKSDECDTPFGQVGTIDVTLAEYADLYNNPGGTLVLGNAGHKGVLVACVALGNYVAFECSCPHDHDVRLVPNDDHAAVLLSCPSCGSRFELTYGNPLEGSATGCSLYQYSTSFDGRELSIY